MSLRWILFFWFSTVLIAPVHAQITPDTTLGAERSRLNSFPSVTAIDGGARRVNNLFHSFTDFNVGAGESVYFLNPTGVQNIFSRVTGKTTSNINGVLGVAGPANLFLLNPNGILFGPNAQLDVSGSFVGTTATGIRFSNQGIFSATQPEAPTLLTVQPSALLFTQLPGRIQSQSSAFAGADLPSATSTGLRVADGQSLLLVGGDIALANTGLTALDGRIELGGLSQPGEIALNVNGGSLQLGFDQTPRSTVAIDKSSLNVRGSTGGDLVITANDITVANGSSFTAGLLNLTNSRIAQAGDITINATGTVSVGQASSITTLSGFGTVDRGRNITINARSLRFDSAELGTYAIGQSNAGDITLNVQDTLSLENASTAASALVFGSGGKAGNLTINTGSLLLQNGGALGSFPALSVGSSGNITINARDRIVLQGQVEPGKVSQILSTPANSQGRGGDIQITTGSLALNPGSLIFSGTVGQGDAGNITIAARDQILLDGGVATSSVAPGAQGRGGDITLTAGSLSVQNGGIIGSESRGSGSSGNVTVRSDTVTIAGTDASQSPSSIITGLGPSSNTLETDAKGGNIDIATGSFVLRDRGTLVSSSVFRRGNSGDITIRARDRILLSNNAGIATFTYGQGNAGKLSLEAGDQITLDRSAVLAGAISLREFSSFANRLGFTPEQIARSTNTTLDNFNQLISLSPTTAGNANDIVVKTGVLRLSNNSALSTSAGSGNGGNIRIQADQAVLLRSQSQISTNAGIFELGGNGGNIAIDTPFLIGVPRENSRINANAFTGQGGNVFINTSGLYGLEPRSTAPDFRNDFLNTPLTTGSEITASSRLGVQGQIDIVRPDVQPVQGTIELPTAPIPGNQIAQACPRGNSDRPLGSFVVSGRGSAPASPIEPLSGSPTIPLATAERTAPSAIAPPERSPQIIEAQNWVKSRDGKVTLVARSAQTGLSAGLCPQK